MAALRSQRQAVLMASNLFRFNKTPTNRYSTTVKECDVKKSVFISQSNNIYTNLALEDWIYRNFDLTKNHILLLSRNAPCMIIGRHQNPWLETNVSNLLDSDIDLARRSTGGGAIYNDLGNLNLTFFTPSERYNKRYNMEIMARGIFRKYGLKVNVTPNENLTLRNLKYVSKNASKLGRTNSYYQCSLLIETNKDIVNENLQKQEGKLKTPITPTDKNTIMNLCDENPKVSVVEIMEAIGWEFMRTPAFTLKDGGLQLANVQNGFQMVNPTDSWFPGLQDIAKQFSSWEWRFGKTPKFTVTYTLQHSDLHVLMDITNGKIQDANINSRELQGIVKDLIGSKYSADMIEKLDSFIGDYKQKTVMTSSA